MAGKKDLRAAAARGADLFFSGADNAQEQQEAQQAYDVDKAPEAIQPHKAQEESPEVLAATIEAMQQDIEADAERKREAAEARQTQGRKGYKMPRLMITLTPSGMEHVRVMAGLTGKSVTRYISDLVDKDAEANKALFEKAKELIKDAR